MRLTLSEINMDGTPLWCSGKTSPEYSAPRTTPSGASWDDLLEQTLPYHPEQGDGRVRVWLPAQKGKRLGGSSTLNISECPNDAEESSLSQVLETTSIPQKYFLSARACEGILKRAERRGKVLPDTLRAALERSVRTQSREPAKASGGALGGGSETLIVDKCYDMTHACDVIRENGVVPTLNARMGTGGNQIPIVLSHPQGAGMRSYSDGKTGALTATKSSEPVIRLAENTIGRKPENGGNGNGWQKGVSYTLNATGVHGVCVPIDTMNIGERKDGSNGLGIGVDGDPSYTLTKGHAHAIATERVVRKLTPIECERLQGFPDNWTKIPYRGKSAEECPDSPRYKAIGNSWAVPCVRWIGERIKGKLNKQENQENAKDYHR